MCTHSISSALLYVQMNIYKSCCENKNYIETVLLKFTEQTVKLILANFHLPVQIFSISPLRAHLRFILCFFLKMPISHGIQSVVCLKRIFNRDTRAMQNFFSSFFSNCFFWVCHFYVFFSTFICPQLLSTCACLCANA